MGFKYPCSKMIHEMEWKEAFENPGRAGKVTDHLEVVRGPNVEWFLQGV